MKLPASYRRNLVYAYTKEVPELPVLPEGYDFKLLGPSELEEFFSSDEMEGRRTRYVGLLEAGCAGYLIVKDGQWAAVAWLAPTGTRMPDHLPPRVVAQHNWLLQAHTRPEHRGKGLHKYLLARRLQDLAAGNAAQPLAVSDVSERNAPSRASHLSSGFKEKGTIHTWDVAGYRLPKGRYGFWNKFGRHNRRTLS